MDIQKFKGMSITQFETSGKKTQEFTEASYAEKSKVFRAFNQKKGKLGELAENLMNNPNILTDLHNMYKYRTRRFEQAWASVAIQYGIMEREEYVYTIERTDLRRRESHNKALVSFCRVVLNGNPLGYTKSNTRENEGYFRERTDYSLYAGKLMDPFEFKDNYGDPGIRGQMTDGMFQLLAFIETLPVADIEYMYQRMRKTPKVKQDEFLQFSRELRHSTKEYGLKEPVLQDEFSTDVFDERDFR